MGSDGCFKFASVMDGSLRVLSRMRFDSIDARCADGITPDAYRLVYWTMVLPHTLVRAAG